VCVCVCVCVEHQYSTNSIPLVNSD
jgi:hypothetical protein